MRVSEVIALAGKWVEQTGSGFPGFRGAYLAGSINELSEDEAFPLFKDVDVYVVLEDPAQVAVPQAKFLYEGVLLEYVCKSVQEHSPEEVLASMSAETLARGRIVSDPTGFLGPLQRTVAADYARPEWIAARVERHKLLIAHLFSQAGQSPDPVFFLGFAVLFLGGLVALASFKSPTVRRCLVVTGELLEKHGRPDLHDDFLELMGAARMEREEVVGRLEECVEAFDRAVEVIATPFYTSWNIDPGTRRYLVEGSYEMIDAGRHREAMFWIAMMHCISHMAIQNDAPEADKSHFRAGMERLRAALGIATAAEWSARMELAGTVSGKVQRFADEAVSRLA
jgi:hypothetical protein